MLLNDFPMNIRNVHNVKSVGIFPSSLAYNNSIGCDCGFACDKHFPNGNVCHVVGDFGMEKP